jgi:pimeloyl-ACP methyl ester carboxylesterase
VIALLDHLNIRKAHIVGYSMGGLVALKLIAEHPDRALSGTLGGMGWMPEGGGIQRLWAHMHGNGSRSVSELALSENELKAIRVRVLILVGDRDPIRRMYVAPLQKERADWQVIEIKDAGHLNCIFKKQFIDEIEKWLNANRQK